MYARSLSKLRPCLLAPLLVLIFVGAHEVCEQDSVSRESAEPSLLQSNRWKSSLKVSPAGEEVFKEYEGDVNEVPHYSLLEMNHQTGTLSHRVAAMQRAVSKRYLSYQAHSSHLRRSSNGLKDLLEIAANVGAAAATVKHAAAATKADVSEPSNVSGDNTTLALLSGAKQNKTTDDAQQSFQQPDPLKDGSKVSSFSELIEKFTDAQSNSEDVCHAQLLEAKNQLNSLSELVSDLVDEVNSSEKSMILYDKELKNKLQEISEIQDSKDEQLKKCKKKKKEDAEFFVKLSQELKEMEQIASPGVSMNMSAKNLHTRAALDQEQAQSSNETSLLQTESSHSLRHHAARYTIPELMNSTRAATVLYNRCMMTSARSLDTDADTDTSSDTNSVAFFQVQNATTPEECKRQREKLKKTYVKAYVELARLTSDYEKLSKDSSCEDTVEAEFVDQHDPLREQTERLSKVSGETAKELKDNKPFIEQAEIAEAKLRNQVIRLGEQCGQLGTTVSDLDKVREVIRALSDCPGLSRVEFLVPKWTGKWVSFMQDSKKNKDEETDSLMNLACKQASQGSRAAETGEIEERSIQDIPPKLTSTEPLLGACPNCAGEDDKIYKSGHARVCWKSGSSLDFQGENSKCSNGKMVILCVIDRGSIRSLPS